MTEASEPRGLLRILTCGSVDDGKSSLIGRILRDCGLIPDDVLAALVEDSRRHGRTGAEPDLALLVDGLEAERQQGITIDVAYRFFATANRSFVVADAPGHEQYTRNMATGASNSDLALVLIDARKGVLTQTRRHTHICALLGIGHVVLVVNKMDLVGWSEDVFDQIVRDYEVFADTLGFRAIAAIPVSARHGDNVVARSAHAPWYKGPALITHLESVDVERDATTAPFRMSVQWVNRPDADFRGVSGTISSGRIGVNEPIVLAASGKASRVASILGPGGAQDSAVAGEAVTLCLAEEIDLARGDMLCAGDRRPVVADQFAAHILWTNEEPLFQGRQYLLRAGNLWTSASITGIRHGIDVNTLEPQPVRRVEMNGIALCHLATAVPVAFDPYEENRATGAFILVDRFTNRTAGAGMIKFALRRATNVHREDMLIDKAARAEQNGQAPMVLWFTGLPGSGKSSIAKLVEQRLHLAGRRTYTLDGDNLRHGLNHDLGFTDADRVENIRRAGEVAKLFVDAGMIVLCAFVSPFRNERQAIRDLCAPGEFLEVFVDTSIDECVRRDPKGLYARAKSGAIPNFTGIDSPYEAPEAAEMHLRTEGTTPSDLADIILAKLRERGQAC
ncbi:MAG: bifunctional sulfate adenylyltransferase/adenylyl-sulfate kinase CysN/CysC [Hyphomicrobiales bacterium]|nr:bifunctional sulfate adenylyltransferase/adenylyl-sulfate kinase CysN/CysC [Hyphomicrobiales bacterium]